MICPPPTSSINQKAIPPSILSVDQWQFSEKKKQYWNNFPMAQLFENLQTKKFNLVCELQKALSDIISKFHAFSLLQERPLKLLLRGVPRSFLD